MKANLEILTELREISPSLSAARVSCPYRVPDGYFSALPGSIAERLQASPVLPEAERQAFRVPEGYFKTLAGAVMEKIRTESRIDNPHTELAEVAPLLNSISRKDIYSVPAGYFDMLAVRKPGKLVALRNTRKWMQYATAAVVTGLLVTAAFLFTDDSSYRKYSKMDVPVELQQMTENDLAGYLYNPERLTVGSQEMAADVNENIRALSDEELTNYLSENRDAEMAIAVSN